MNKIANRFFLTGDHFIPEMHLKQPEFTYSACGPFTKNKERIKNFKVTGDSKYFYQNELDKAFLQHDMAYGDFHTIPRRTPSDKVLRAKPFNVSKNPKYDGYQTGLNSIAYKIFGKKSSSKNASGVSIKSEIISNK